MGNEWKSLEAIRYKRGHLELLDQTKLPQESVYVEIGDSEAAWHAIKDMVVRGAPAIAVTAVLALAVEIVNLLSSFEGDSRHAASFIEKRLNFLVSSRPTAVNLADASEKLQNLVSEASILGQASAKSVFEEYVRAAETVLADDVISNKAIGEFGAEAILSSVPSKGKLKILTHCNTGSLATAGYGTALGVIRSLHSLGKLETAYCTETRPYNQGSRLTAYELVHDEIPGVLVADSAVGALLASGRVDAIVVGADRIAANGDTANKIGTFNVALAAHQLEIPFFVAAPVTSVDTATSSGQEIVIEERAHSELTNANGGRGPQIAAPGIGVWNPAFDVTAAKFITAIITDKGVLWREKNSIRFDVAHFIDSVDRTDLPAGAYAKGSHENTVEVANGILSSSDRIFEKTKTYFQLNEKGAIEYLSRIQTIVGILGGPSEGWNIQEIGDGNLNFVYIVEGTQGSIILKQSLPYVRCVGDSWPMTTERTYFEYRALKKEFELVPDLVPEVYHFDRPMGVIAMRYLEPPHVILRKGLINGIVYPLLAEHMSTFMSKTLFHSSLLALSSYQHKDAVAQSYGNVEMCRLTEQVVFNEPYMVAANNRWTSPQLDDEVKLIREDNDLKLEIAELKSKFCSLTQALLHGDLHTGSIMVTETSTKVIDPEFSFYGPSGFDVGAFIGNLILAYYSQDEHAQCKGDREKYKSWILHTIFDTWDLFDRKFRAEWDRRCHSPGDAYVSEVFNSVALSQLAQTRYLRELFHDSLGFAGAKMIRRIVGIAHVEDLESILDADRRAAAERKALKAAKFLIKQRKSLTTMNQVLDFLRDNP